MGYYKMQKGRSVPNGGEKMKRLVVDMDESLHTAIKIEALKQGTSAKKLVTEMIEKYLETKKEQTR